MRNILVLVLLTLSGCAIYSHETMVSTFLLEGGIRVTPPNGNNKYHIIELWEKKPEGGDMHSYRTDSPETRLRTVKHLFRGASCSDIIVHDETQFTENYLTKKWLNGAWWRLQAECVK